MTTTQLKLNELDKNKYEQELLTFNSNNNLWYYNNKKLIKLLYPNREITNIKFKNNDYNDYRRENLIVKFKENNIKLPSNYKIIQEFEPHLIEKGRHSGESKNKYWLVSENSDDNKFYIMHIKDEIFTKFSCESLDKILNYKSIIPSWCILPSGYVYYKYNKNDIIKHLYLHQLVLGVEDEDFSDYKNTVDHINCNKLDNRLTNLRIVDMNIQNSNRDKPSRRKDACDLPNGIKQTDLPKYVCYRKEILNKETGNFREYFYIKHHPKIGNKRYESSKSNKITLTEKLEQIKKKLEQIDNDESSSSDSDIEDTPVNNTEIADFETIKSLIKLPQYCYLSNTRDKLTLNFEKRTEKMSLKYVLKTNNLQHDFNEFSKEVNKKYSTINIDKITFPINLLNKIGLNQEIIITEPEEKLVLPPNFSFYKESINYFYSYSKVINKKRYNKKYKLVSNDLQKEFDNFIEIINNQFKDDINIKPYTITNIPSRYKNLF